MSTLRCLVLALLLLPAAALAEQLPLLCQAQAEARCEGGTCVERKDSFMEVTLWPEPTPVEACRALSCEPDLPRIAVCGLKVCGWGTVHYKSIDRWEGSEHRTGIAYIAPEPPPRQYASLHYALAYDTGTRRLALSHFDGSSLTTTWFACAQR